MRSFTDSELPDTDNIVPFENTTSINQNKKGKITERSRLMRLIEVVFSKGYNVVSVRQIWVSKRTQYAVRTHTDQQKNKSLYSRGSPEVPMN